MRYEMRVVASETVDDAYDFQCACGFTSAGWPLKKHATARGEQHAAEHDSGDPAPELLDFRIEHGLAADVPRGDVVRFPDGEVGAQ